MDDIRLIRAPRREKTLQDFADDFQDLDDLLEDALEEGGSDSAADVGEVFRRREDVDKKLSDLDALLRAEAAACDSSTNAERAIAPSDKALEAFLGGANGLERGDQAKSRGGELGEEEERLLQMVSFIQLKFILVSFPAT